MPESNIDTLVKTLISTEIIKALNNAPDAVEKMVMAALQKPVGSDGKWDSYGSKMPYLDYLVGNEIRSAACDAVRTVLAERAPLIAEQVRKGLSEDTVVAAVTKSLIGAASQDWQIKVSFEADKGC